VCVLASDSKCKNQHQYIIKQMMKVHWEFHRNKAYLFRARATAKMRWSRSRGKRREIWSEKIRIIDRHLIIWSVKKQTENAISRGHNEITRKHKFIYGKKYSRTFLWILCDFESFFDAISNVFLTIIQSPVTSHKIMHYLLFRVLMKIPLNITCIKVKKKSVAYYSSTRVNMILNSYTRMQNISTTRSRREGERDGKVYIKLITLNENEKIRRQPWYITNNYIKTLICL
jgi:hypothetical protein